MSALPFTQPLRVSQLNARRPLALDIAPDAAARARIAVYLGILSLPALRLTGTLAAAPHGAWTLEARLTARVEQACVVTLAPVFTDLAENIRRVWSPHVLPPEGEEVEMSDDETEPLGTSIDPGAVLVEALALALPPYPRAGGAALPETATDPDDEDAAETRRPFAGLADMIRRKED